MDNMDKIIERINQAISRKGFSYPELSKMTGISKSSLQRYATGATKKIPIDVIDAIAKATGTETRWIMCWDSPDKPLDARPLPPVFTCGYFHSVSAGIGAYADEQSERYSYCFSSQSQADRCFAVDVEGDSMEPELHDGDVAIVDTDEEPQNGDIVVMYDKADELGYIKRYRITNNCVMFISLNPAYDTMVFPLSDFTDRIVIHGKVIAVNRKY